MDPSNLIPTPDTIPAPAPVFIALELLTFLLHILIINSMLGGSLILFFSKSKMNKDQFQSNQKALAKKIPVLIALGINMGVAPLLFVQVVYGHLFYSSSVLMAVFWIMVIPLLILAYYSAYVHASNYSKKELLGKTALGITILFVLYIGLMLVNNNSMMEQPETWGAYFDNRDGTILNLSDPTLIPRYLHFVTASVAIGGLFLSTVWFFRKRKGIEVADEKIKTGLKIFAIGTSVQIAVGFWYLLSIPSEFMLKFMGQDMIATIFLMIGIAAGVGALIFGFLGKYIPAVVHLLLTLIAMIITRFNLRTFYLEDNFQISSLELSPQYFVMFLFFAVFIIGLASVGYMLKISQTTGRAA